jgi:hypothetical protein
LNFDLMKRNVFTKVKMRPFWNEIFLAALIIFYIFIMWHFPSDPMPKKGLNYVILKYIISLKL